MRVCVNRTRSALKLQQGNKFQLTNDESSTSTALNNDDDSADSENLKMPALLSSNENKDCSQEKDDVSSTNSGNSDSLL